VVGVYSDTHVFSDTEIIKFDVLRVGGSVADVQRRIQQLSPIVTMAYKWKSDNKYHFGMPNDPDVVIGEIEVFQVSKRWYKAVSNFKFRVNVAMLTAEEKQLLETIDINNPSVDSYIKKTVKDYTLLPGNNVEIVELRNTVPY
jgi:hypothetical protein